MGITTGRQQQRKSMGGTFNGKLKKNKKIKQILIIFLCSVLCRLPRHEHDEPLEQVGRT